VFQRARELQAREEHAHLLAVVHAVEDHHGGGFLQIALRNSAGRVAAVFVRDFDALQFRIAAGKPGLLALERLAADLTLLLAGIDKRSAVK